MGVSPVQAAAPPLVTPTSAPLGDQSQSFLDNAIALFDHFRAWNCSDETAPSAVWSRWRSPEQTIGDLAEADAPGAAAAIFDLDGADDQHFALMAASATPGDWIVFAAASDFGFIHLARPASRLRPGASMYSATSLHAFPCRQPRPQ